jgi:hypothetical protein
MPYYATFGKVNLAIQNASTWLDLCCAKDALGWGGGTVVIIETCEVVLGCLLFLRGGGYIP